MAEEPFQHHFADRIALERIDRDTVRRKGEQTSILAGLGFSHADQQRACAEFSGGWFGMFAPFGTPDPIIQRLSAEVRLALGNSAVQSRLATLGLRPIGSTSEEFRRYVNSEINYYADVVKLTGIKDE